MKKQIFLTKRSEFSNVVIQNVKKMIKGKVSNSRLCITLDDITKEEADNVLSYLRTVGKFEIDMEVNYYTDEELMEFDFFYCTGPKKADISINHINFELEMNGNASFDYTDFCPICKQGLKQISPFVVKGLSKKYSSKKMVNPFWQYWVVSSELKQKIIQQNITGVDFWELINYKGDASKTNFQMKPARVLKNALDLKSVKFLDNDCSCKNFRIGIPDMIVRLHKESESSFLDFTELYEHNLSKTTGMYIISKKLLCTFIAEGIMPHRDIDVQPAVFV